MNDSLNIGGERPTNPAGSNTQIQYNDGNARFGADSDLTWDKVARLLRVGGDVDISGHLAVGNVAAVVDNSVAWIFEEFYTNADNRGLTATIKQMVPSTAPNYPAALRFETNYYGSEIQAYRLSGVYGHTRVMPTAGDTDGIRGVQGTSRHSGGVGVVVGNAFGARFSVSVDGGGTINMAANCGTSNIAITAGRIIHLAGFWVENPNITGGVVDYFYGLYLPNFTGAGVSWGVYQVGVNDNYLAGKCGLGTNAPTSRLDLKGSLAHKVVTKTANYTASDETVILCNATDGVIIITLPASASNPDRTYYIKKIDSSANQVTIDADGVETIDGALTYALTSQWDVVQIVTDGSNWFII